MARIDKRFFAHVRFFANAKKISHGLLNPPEAITGKELSRYIPLIIRKFLI